MWNPYVVCTRSLSRPGSIENATCSNSGTIPATSEEIKIAAAGSRSFVLRVSHRERCEICVSAHLGEDGFSPLTNGRLVLALGQEQDVAGPHLFGDRVLIDPVVVGTLDILW